MTSRLTLFFSPNMPNVKDCVDVQEKALGLLKQALELLQSQQIPGNQGDSVKKPGVKTGQLKVSPEHEALLNTWVQAHITWWVPHYWRVHDHATFTPAVLMDAFFDAVKAGRKDVLKWLLSTQDSTGGILCFLPHVPPDAQCVIVCQAAKECGHKIGHSEGTFTLALLTGKWAAKTGNLEALQVLKDWGFGESCMYSYRENIISIAVKHGQVTVLQFIKDNWNMIQPNFIEYILLKAAEHGQVGVLQFLKTVWGCTADTARAGSNQALRQAAMNGHVEVLKFLKTAFGLTAEDARCIDNHALGWAAKNGHLEVLKFLKDGFGLTADDARADNNYALRIAVTKGHRDVVMFLTTWIFGQEQ
jgi:hypothetical protein